MEFFRIKKTSRSCAMRWSSTSSPSSPSAAVFFLFTRGLHLSIEFTGGTVMEVQPTASRPTWQGARHGEALGFGDVQVQNFGTSRDVMIRLPVQQGNRARRSRASRC
jgi:preprotein translocase subunit SecF